MPYTAHRQSTYFPGRNQQETTIEQSSPDGMEWMETDAAATWIKNRIREKVVNVDEHRSHHN